MSDLKGICVPICTPFDKSGDKVDEGALTAHVDSLLDAGVHIILSCGGTGEFAYLTEAERRRIHTLVGKQIQGKARYVVQSSAISTRDTIENAKVAENLGAEAIMVLPPYFEGPTMDGVMWHYEHVAKAIKTPIVIYNIPQHTNRDVTPDLFARLLKIENIQYIKDSTGNFTRIQQLVATGGKVFNGGDTLMFPALMSGCTGVIWGGANATPREAVQLHDLVAAGKLAEAAALWKRILPAQLFFWTHDYNSAVKTATNLLGGKVGICRKPALPLTDAEVAELRQALGALGRPLASAA
ncbi:dihydrodipicolinate synthase family protein [Hypericibacter sp.]|uniref:dihydrodipicolinate synthase family protein n=1 Tax=Hypericibacter sp. TaxID=2705401 RepID=UPI003D6CEE8A